MPEFFAVFFTAASVENTQTVNPQRIQVQQHGAVLA